MTSANGALRAKTRGSWLIMNWPLGITGDCFDREQNSRGPGGRVPMPMRYLQPGIKREWRVPRGGLVIRVRLC